MKRPRYPDILPVLNQASRTAFEEFYNRVPDHDHRTRVLARGDDISCRYGPLTRDVARAYGQSLAVTRRMLDRGIQEGKVLVDRRPGGMSRWWPVGLAASLRQEGA